MSPYYRRTPPGARENLSAALVSAGLALGVASVSFYLVRTFLAREAFPELPPKEEKKRIKKTLPAEAEEGRS